jgi:hypothetical protein
MKGVIIFWVLVVLGAVIYAGIYFYSLSHVGKPPF